MSSNYEEVYQLFINYVESQLVDINDKLEKVDYYNRIIKIYNDIKGKDYSKFIEYYSVLSGINPNIKDNLDVIDFLVKNNITIAPQMNESIDNILNDAELLKIVGTTLNKEMLSGQKEKLSSVIDGTYDFETFKNILLDSNLDIDSVICILTREAEKSTISNEKKNLPSLDESNLENKEIISKHNEVLNKVNKLIDKYYHLIKGKPLNVIEMYRKAMSSYSMNEINSIFGEKDVLLCIHMLRLIDLKNEGEDLLNTKPIDHELLEVNIEEINEELELARNAAKDYEKLMSENMPLDSTVYYLLDEDGEPLFNIQELSPEEKKNVDIILSDLEMGLFDYESNKRAHTMVRQNERKDLNVFVNRKRNMSVSYVRINSSDLKDSRVLVLAVSDYRKIFDESISTLKTKSPVIDQAITHIKENDSEFISKQDSFKETLKVMLNREEVPSK